MSLILIDTNLSVLWFVGITSPSYIARHKRLQGYDEGDFEAVSEYIAASDQWLLCPHVLAETSNLLRHISDPYKTRILQTFASLVAKAKEAELPSREATKHPMHDRLGLTDSVLLVLAERGGVLLTVDLDLYVAAVSSGFEAINYNHDRDRRYSL